MGKKKKIRSVFPTTAQADPLESEDDVFGEEDETDELSNVEDFTEAPKELPLNQVPGKYRKFLTNKD